MCRGIRGELPEKVPRANPLGVEEVFAELLETGAVEESKSIPARRVNLDGGVGGRKGVRSQAVRRRRRVRGLPLIRRYRASCKEGAQTLDGERRT